MARRESSHNYTANRGSQMRKSETFINKVRLEILFSISRLA